MDDDYGDDWHNNDVVKIKMIIKKGEKEDEDDDVGNSYNEFIEL